MQSLNAIHPQEWSQDHEANKKRVLNLMPSSMIQKKLNLAPSIMIQKKMLPGNACLTIFYGIPN